MAEHFTPPASVEPPVPPARRPDADGATITERYPLTSLHPATGEALATAAPHAHETRAQAISIFEPTIVRGAIGSAFAKLDPRYVAKNPVMFVVEVGSAITTVIGVSETVRGAGDSGFVWAISVWLWFTVLFANFAEAMAEGRGKAQADTLRKTRSETMAKLEEADHVKLTPSSMLRKGDIVQCGPGDVIPGDGEVIEGIASVDESAITGESAPVIRESGGDRSAVTGGTRVLSDFIRVRITSNPGETFLDRMIALVEGAARQKTPNEIALNILLAVLTIIFLAAVVSLEPFAIYSNSPVSITVLIALLVCLIPTTIGALLSAIGIAGMDRLVQHNVLAMSGRAVEAAGDVSTLLLDKTGTITLGNRQAVEFLPVAGVSEAELARAAELSSLADETPEGRSIVALAARLDGRDGASGVGTPNGARFVPFTAQTRMSGIDDGERAVRKGADDAVQRWLEEQGGRLPDDLAPIVERIARSGGTPLVVAEGGVNGQRNGAAPRALGVIHLKDIVKGGMRERFDQLRAMGIRTVMITGDNPLTAAAIAREAGVDDFLAQATPETKMELIKREQAGGRLVAMTGDGTNDAPALAQADVGVAMNTGTNAAKEAGNMVDLDSNPTKLIEVVAIGKQLLITRGALTTFSIANDVAKYFAIIPALFAATYPELNTLNVMHLHSSRSAILSAVIFNALIIVALIPLALRGVQYRPVGAAALLRRNLLIYGVGGIIAPFIGIKAIDLVLQVSHLT
jgi:K+-transporting ATPase ATPase B chain